VLGSCRVHELRRKLPALCTSTVYLFCKPTIWFVRLTCCPIFLQINVYTVWKEKKILLVYMMSSFANQTLNLWDPYAKNSCFVFSLKKKRKKKYLFHFFYMILEPVNHGPDLKTLLMKCRWHPQRVESY
jgi:hypothetical protein